MLGDDFVLVDGRVVPDLPSGHRKWRFILAEVYGKFSPRIVNRVDEIIDKYGARCVLWELQGRYNISNDVLIRIAGPFLTARPPADAPSQASNEGAANHEPAAGPVAHALRDAARNMPGTNALGTRVPRSMKSLARSLGSF